MLTRQKYEVKVKSPVVFWLLSEFADFTAAFHTKSSINVPDWSNFQSISEFEIFFLYFPGFVFQSVWVHIYGLGVNLFLWEATKEKVA